MTANLLPKHFWFSFTISVKFKSIFLVFLMFVCCCCPSTAKSNYSDFSGVYFFQNMETNVTGKVPIYFLQPALLAENSRLVIQQEKGDILKIIFQRKNGKGEERVFDLTLKEFKWEKGKLVHKDKIKKGVPILPPFLSPAIERKKSTIYKEGEDIIFQSVYYKVGLMFWVIPWRDYDESKVRLKKIE